MRIEHVALWARSPEGLERLRAFYETYFGARAGSRYESARRPGFASYFLDFPGDAAAGGARLELMTAPDVAPGGAGGAGDAAGWAHVALAVGSRAAVDLLAARLAADGLPLVSPPRLTGDGYYEAVVRDPEGNLLEITA
jgi:lactoylglutathione lyase